MKTLHLNLIRQWFDIVYKLIKPEEYREIKLYWCVRFLLYHGDHHKESEWECILGGICAQYNLNDDADAILKGIKEGLITFKPFDTITFSNGHKKDRDQFEIELKSIEIREGKTKWGAEPGKKYFVLAVGKILSSNVK